MLDFVMFWSGIIAIVLVLFIFYTLLIPDKKEENKDNKE